MKSVAALVIAASAIIAGQANAAMTKLVVCAPGYPGSTAEAQPSLDAFARAAAKAAGWPDGSVRAIYHPTEEAGLAALADPDTSLALVAWPFFDKHAGKLQLAPLAQAVYKSTGPDEVWSLVVKKGRIRSADQLKGWEIISLAGYAPEFVRDRALAPWGALPAETRITAGSQVLSALRRAASGNDVAVLLDGTQSAALASLPFAAELEVVAASPRVPVAVLCAIGTRLPAARGEAFARALESLHENSTGAAALEGIRLTGFVPPKPPIASGNAKAGATRK